MCNWLLTTIRRDYNIGVVVTWPSAKIVVVLRLGLLPTIMVILGAFEVPSLVMILVVWKFPVKAMSMV